MDLTGWLLARAHPHALVVTAPGGTRARLAVELALRERGWPAATTPAEADLLVSCGPLGLTLAGVVEQLWRQVPNPRARVHVQDTGQTAAALAAGRARLLDAAGQRSDAAVRRTAPVDQQVGTRHGSDGTHEQHHDAHAAPGRGSGRGHDHRSDHGGHGGSGAHGHGHHGQGMGMPAGLAMADRAPDRDGLKLDQLHVPLGPVLPDWPAGLVLHTALQGDVIQQAHVEVLDIHATTGDPAASGSQVFWDEPWLRALAGGEVTRAAAARRCAAAHLDSLARLLGVAGWEDATLAAHRLRDDLLAGLAAQTSAGRFARLARRLRRSRTLRWLTDGLGLLPPDLATARGVGGPARRAGGDVTARWLRWLEETATALDAADDPRSLSHHGQLEAPRGALAEGTRPSRALLDVLPEMVVGAELAAARLIVASLDPDTDELVGAPIVEAAHG
jgi:hypothetical protein